MPVSPRFSVLVVDDSQLSREALKRALELDPQLRVVAEASTGEQALALVHSVRPALVTMDLNMPGMGGLRAIEAIMRERPTPIVVISERSPAPGVDLNYEALSRGALELVPKSAVFGVRDDDVRRFAERMRLVAAARGLDLDEVRRGALPAVPLSSEVPALIGIGASTGGPRALAKLLGELPPEFPLPIAVVQHMAEDFFDSFVRFLGDASRKPVELAQGGGIMKPGRVYVAPPRQELFVRHGLVMKLGPSPRDAIIAPSVDSLFFSMATALKGRGVGILLTGMGDDGAQGLLRMRRMGARTVAQDRASCAVFGMPRAAQELGAAELVLPLDEIAQWVVATARTATPGAERGGDAAEALRRRQVLVLDDDPVALAATSQALKGAGYGVVALDNPLMLASALRKTHVELVLIEPELATMKGAMVLATLREHDVAHAPVVLCSKLTGPALEARARECGASGAVSKDDRARLLREVARLLVTTPTA
jgi:two-component system chemotaxis response regulator CheB